MDTVSGATYSSVGIIEAVRNALSQAGGSSSNTATTPGGTSGNGTSSGGTSEEQVLLQLVKYKIHLHIRMEFIMEQNRIWWGFNCESWCKCRKNCFNRDYRNERWKQFYTKSFFDYFADYCYTKYKCGYSVRATYSSVGIIEAVRNALSQAAISNDGTNGQQPSNPQQPSQPEDSDTAEYYRYDSL